MPAIDIGALEDDPVLREVWEGLGRARCHATGGYVRDRLLGRESTDVDLVAPGSIDDAAGSVRQLADRLGVRAHVLGRGERRVWRVEATGLTVELWPLGDLSPEDDVRRRDFTCNAMSWQLPCGPLDDRVGGLDDLASRTLRGIARINFELDPVRLVRAARFTAQLEGFEIEPRTAGWIRSLAPRLALAPRERVGQELLKTVSAPRALRGLLVLLEADLLSAAAPAAAATDAVWLRRHLDAVPRLSGAAGHAVTGALRAAGEGARLGLLLRAWGSPDEAMVTDYAWGRDLRRDATRAAALFSEAVATAAAPVARRRIFIHIAGEAFPAVIGLAAAVEPDCSWQRWWRLWRHRGRELVEPEPLLGGTEIADLLGLAPGPELGAASKALLEAQVAGSVRTPRGARRWLSAVWSHGRARESIRWNP